MCRSAVAQVARLWLTWIVATTAVSPLAIWTTMAHTTPAAAVHCKCSHTPGIVCPMHHTSNGRTECALRSATSHDGSALLSLLGPIGVVPFSAITAVTQGSSPVPADVRTAIDRPLAPESPPPRV
jgi:hypothetical protein